MFNHLVLTLAFGILAVGCNGERFAEAGGSAKTLTSGQDLAKGEEPSNTDEAGKPEADDETVQENGEGKKDKEKDGADLAASELDCAGLKGKNVKRMNISGSENVVTLGGEDALVLKVTGNQNKVSMKIESQEGALQALCLSVAGNENQVSVEIDAQVEKFIVKARGNQARIELATSESGVLNALESDISGNDPKIVLKGPGARPCDAASGDFVCE